MLKLGRTCDLVAESFRAGRRGFAYQVSMGEQLQSIVEHIRTNSRGLPSLDLARLNLRVGKPISRCAATLPDDPELVAAAWKAARAILAEPEGLRR